ncbi:MAG: DUF3164 family protein [Dinoroseobacter sp.]|nr:DUF3164 family protein [Dinoroseobacter sp.]
MTAQTSKFVPAEIENGRKTIDDKEYIRDAKGGWTPIEMAKPQDLLIDEQVRKIMGHALALSQQIARFKGHTFEDLASLDGMLAQEYGVTIGGAKGNKTFMSHDGLWRIEVRIADFIDFGPELQIAKTLIDECLNEWSAEAGPEIRAIVTRAFNTDKPGQINRSEIFTLMRLEIKDERWQQAMKALRDAMRVVGSKTYLRFQHRPHPEAPLETITIDLAKA